jgi:hypothetical protein
MKEIWEFKMIKTWLSMGEFLNAAKMSEAQKPPQNRI